MKIIKNLMLAALAVATMLQPGITRADDRGKRDQDRCDARATFTKWVTAFPNQPGRIIDLGGVVGGNVGDGTFSGEVLFYNPGATVTSVTHIVAFYHFVGPKHSFTALVNVVQTGSGPGTKAAITGVVTEGWLKGHAVEGKYTEGMCGTPSMACYSGFLKVEGDSND